MRLLLTEPDPTGHHMALYVRYVVRAAVRRGWDVRLLTTAGAVDHPAYRMVADEAGRDIVIGVLRDAAAGGQTSAGALLVNQMKWFASLRDAFAALPVDWAPDMVHMSNLDYCDKAIALRGSPFGGTIFSGLLMSMAFHRRSVGLKAPASRQDTMLRWLCVRLLRTATLKAVPVIDESFAAYAALADEPVFRKVHLVPEPGAGGGEETRAAARTALNLPGDAFVILAYGDLTERKGIPALLAALAHPDMPAEIMVLLAGTCDAATRAVVDAAGAPVSPLQTRIVVVEGFLSDSDEYRVFRAADAVWLGYSNFYGASGVLMQAARMGLPTVATNAGLIGRRTEQHGLGITLDPSVPGDVAAALARLKNDGDLRMRVGEAALAFAATRTGDHFGEAVCEVIAGGGADTADTREGKSSS